MKDRKFDGKPYEYFTWAISYTHMLSLKARAKKSGCLVRAVPEADGGYNLYTRSEVKI